MSLAVPVVPGGRAACPLGTARLVATPAPCHARVCALAQRQLKRSGLLPALPGRRASVRVFGNFQQDSGAQKDSPSLLATLPQWCHRLTGAFLLVPFLVLSGSRNAVAQTVRSPSMDTYPAAAVRPNPLFETSSVLDVRNSPQARAAAALATALVGYGFVRSSVAGGGSSSGGGSFRSSVKAGATASLIEAPPMPPTPRARTERLDQLYYEIEDLKRRNALVWENAMMLMERDASLSVTAATVKAAESMDLDNPAEAAAAAIAANSATAELITSSPDAASAAGAAAGLPIRPSGGASRGLPTVSLTVGDVTATAAASVAAAVVSATEAGTPPVRPSGGASRLSYTLPSGLPGGLPYDSRVPPVPIPERPGGASSRARARPLTPPPSTAPPPPLQLPPDSSRIEPADGLNLAAWAGEVLEKTANADDLVPPPPPQGPATAAGSTPGKLNSRFTRIFYNPVADGKAAAAAPPPPPPSSPRAEDTFRPSMRPTRRASGAGAQPTQRTYRAITPPSLPQPPQRVHPSFDVPENALSPEEYLREADGRTADGRVNPSFASASSAAAPAPVVTATALAPEALETAIAASVAAPVPAPPPDLPMPAPAREPVWYNPLSWFTQRVEGDGAAARGDVTNPSFDASLAVVTEAQEAEAPQSLAASIVQVAEERGQDAGVGAAAEAAVVAWSEALTGGAAAGNFGPVEQVAELLEVAMKTEEFTYPKYDPLRNAISNVTAPSAAHKYDMLRGLLRTSKEEQEQARAAAGAEGQQEPVAAVHKYDLLYDLLQSVRTSGDPAAILASTDPKYDPVWCLLNMRAPARGSLSKYDLVGAMLQAALAASPQPSRYDPLQVLLQAKPITGHSKYCLASVLLHGGWQRPLDSGLAGLPSWDPLSGVVGPSGSSRTARGTVPGHGRRAVSKYDMVGQALEAAAALPEDLASGKWAELQPRDPLLKPRPRQRTTAPRRQQRSKYDLVGQALVGMSSLPEDLSSGRWASSQGRELFVDTLNKTVDGGGWGFLRRVRDGGSAALRAVTAAASPVGNFLAKAVGLPYEVAPGVVMKVERTVRGVEHGSAGGGGVGLGAFPGLRGFGGANEAAAAVEVSAAPNGQAMTDELPKVVFQFKDEDGAVAAAKARKSVPVTATARRRQRGVLPPLREVVPAVAAAVAAPEPVQVQERAAAPKLERAVVPPSRAVSRRMAAATSVVAAPLPSTDVDVPAVAAIAAVLATPEAAVAAADVISTTPAAVAAVVPEEPAVTVSEPSPAAPSPSLKLSDLAVDLLVVMSVQGTRGAAAPTQADLVARFGEGFADIATQLRALRRNTALLARHPAVGRLVRTASAAEHGDGKGMWSQLYDMLGAVRDAEAVLPAFLKDCRAEYPLLYGLLRAGDAGQGVSVLCTLCNLLPAEESPSERQ